MLLKFAFKNLMGAGLRTWLNVFVLSMAFVLIIFTQGLLEGMNKQTEEAMINSEIGGGQYWHPSYDPYNPLKLSESFGPIPEDLESMINEKHATSILITQGSIYPAGRMFTVLIKGIDPAQKVLDMPTHFLATETEEIPILIGSRMAKSTGLRQEDPVTIQWRDSHGTFDARDGIVKQVMNTSVQSIDAGQIWIPLETLRGMMGIEDQATIVVLENGKELPPRTGEWTLKSQDALLTDIRSLIESKTLGSSFVYAILLLLAMLAIFDTEVLSIFHRRKEMGMLMALGFTRFRVIKLFAIEGAMHGVLAVLVGALYGIPILSYMAKTGWALPSNTDNYGFAIGEKLFPSYGMGLVLGTTALVLVVTAIVSFIPTRKIAKMKPTEALRGRLS